MTIPMQRHTIIGQYRICLRYALLWMTTKKNGTSLTSDHHEMPAKMKQAKTAWTLA